MASGTMNDNANRGELDKSAESRHSRVTDRRSCSGGRRGQLSHSGARRCKPSQLVAGGATSFIATTPLRFRRLQPASRRSNEVPPGCCYRSRVGRGRCAHLSNSAQMQFTRASFTATGAASRASALRFRSPSIQIRSSGETNSSGMQARRTNSRGELSSLQAVGIVFVITPA
jgi:hypothetical protein